MLNQFVSVYIPSTNHKTHGDNESLSVAEHAAIAERVASELSGFFGGATSTPARGYWKSETGALVAEDVIIVTSYYSPTDGINPLQIATRIARELAHELNQEAVTIQNNDCIDFISPAPAPALPKFELAINHELAHSEADDFTSGLSFDFQELTRKAREIKAQRFA